MSTVVSVNFSRVLPRNSTPPRVAMADIVELSETGTEERAVREGLVVNLRRGVVTERVPPGTFLIRLRAPTGQLLVKRVQVDDEGDDTSLAFVPEESAHRSQLDYEDSGGSRVVISKSLPGTLAPGQVGARETADRELWTARLVQPQGRPAALDYLPGLPVREVVNERQDFMGVAKLQARPRSDAFWDEHREKAGLSAYLVGDIDAVQAAKLYGPSEELRTQWKYPLRKQSIIGKASQEGRGARYFALSYRATDDFYPLQVACMPGRWVTQDRALAPVEASYHLRRVGKRTMRAIRLEVDDPDYGGLIDFLQQGDLSASMRIVERSLEVLYEKWKNPYAAAMAGYVLVHAGLPQAGWPNWFQWVLNLASRFTGLPDGAILYATLLLQGPPSISDRVRFLGNSYEPFRTALGATLEAVRRGPPLFRYGLKLMATNLDILACEPGVGGEWHAQLRGAQSYVRELSLRVDPDQPFCVFDVAT